MTFGLAAQARHTSRVAGITAKAKVDTPRRRQVIIAKFAVELDSDAQFHPIKTMYIFLKRLAPLIILLLSSCDKLEKPDNLELEHKDQSPLKLDLKDQFDSRKSDNLEFEHIDPSRLELDLKDQSGLSKIIKDSVSLEEIQVRNGLVYIPNTVEPFGGFVAIKYRNGQVWLLTNVENGKFRKIWIWQYNGVQILSFVISAYDMKAGQLKSFLDNLDLKEIDQIDDQIDPYTDEFYAAMDRLLYDTEIERLRDFYLWHRNGKLYKRRLINGSGYEHSEWYENGQLASVTTFNENGLLTASSYLPNGVKCPETNMSKQSGVFVAYHSNGTRMSENNYKNGKLHGPGKRFSESGILITRANYKNGKREGSFTHWFDFDSSNPISIEANYKDGEPHGSYVSYYGDGEISKKGVYVDGKKDGLWIEGYPSKAINYSNGEVLPSRPKPNTPSNLEKPQPQATQQQKQEEKQEEKEEEKEGRRGALAIDATFSEFGEYQQQFYAALQSGWYQEIDFFEPIDTSTRVVVSFRITADGVIDCVEVLHTTASEIATLICQTALTKRSPFRPWTKEMVIVFGQERTLEVVFHYR